MESSKASRRRLPSLRSRRAKIRTRGFSLTRLFSMLWLSKIRETPHRKTCWSKRAVASASLVMGLIRKGALAESSSSDALPPQVPDISFQHVLFKIGVVVTSQHLHAVQHEWPPGLLWSCAFASNWWQNTGCGPGAPGTGSHSPVCFGFRSKWILYCLT